VNERVWGWAFYSTTMNKEEEISQIQEDCSKIDCIRQGLLRDGHALDSEGVKMMDEKLCHLMLELYILTEKNESRKARVLADLGIHLN
jgi:hypothetical protein